MKKLIKFMLAGVFALLFAVPVKAQSQYTVTDLAVTNNLAAAATNALGYLIPATKFTDVGLLIRMNAMSSSTDTSTIVLQKSLEGTTNFSPFASFTFTLNGTTPILYTTNFTLGAVGYLKVSSISNTGSVALTNMFIKYSVKTKTNG